METKDLQLSDTILRGKKKGKKKSKTLKHTAAKKKDREKRKALRKNARENIKKCRKRTRVHYLGLEKNCKYWERKRNAHQPTSVWVKLRTFFFASMIFFSVIKTESGKSIEKRVFRVIFKRFAFDKISIRKSVRIWNRCESLTTRRCNYGSYTARDFYQWRVNETRVFLISPRNMKGKIIAHWISETFGNRFFFF